MDNANHMLFQVQVPFKYGQILVYESDPTKVHPCSAEVSSALARAKNDSPELNRHKRKEERHAVDIAICLALQRSSTDTTNLANRQESK